MDIYRIIKVATLFALFGVLIFATVWHSTNSPKSAVKNCDYVIDTLRVIDSIEVKQVTETIVYDTLKTHVVDTQHVMMLSQTDKVSQRVYPHLLLFIHCTATPGQIEFNCEQINAIAYQRFGILSYHYIVLHNGEVCHNYGDTSPDFITKQEIFAGAKGYNRFSHHLSYVGGVNSRLKAENTLTDMQKSAIVNEVRRLLAINPNLKIVPHRTVAAKDCPSFDVTSFLVEKGIKKESIITNERELKRFIRDNYKYF